jgi:two-component system chemotaxis response regulator CheY
MIVKRTLRQAGFVDNEVSEASNGMEALKAIQANQPNLVLADWNMPEMSGIELLEAIREKNIEVMFGFITSEGTPEMRKRAKDAGALFIISKPFTIDAFQKELGEVIT